MLCSYSDDCVVFAGKETRKSHNRAVGRLGMSHFISVPAAYRGARKVARVAADDIFVATSECNVETQTFRLSIRAMLTVKWERASKSKKHQLLSRHCGMQRMPTQENILRWITDVFGVISSEDTTLSNFVVNIQYVERRHGLERRTADVCLDLRSICPLARPTPFVSLVLVCL